MLAGLVSRVVGGGSAVASAALPSDLEVLGAEAPVQPSVLAHLVAAARADAGARQAIMARLMPCLRPPAKAGGSWCPTYNGLALAEELAKSGPPELFEEMQQGKHFDIMQRLAILQYLECADACVQGMLRSKAGTVQAAMQLRFGAASGTVAAGSTPEAEGTNASAARLASSDACAISSQKTEMTGEEQDGACAVILGGFPQTLNGIDRSHLNGRFVRRTDAEFIVQGRETYWSIDGSYFLFRMRGAGRWIVAPASDIDRNREDGDFGVAHTADHADILSRRLTKFIFISDGTAWQELPDAGVRSVENSDRATEVSTPSPCCSPGLSSSAGTCSTQSDFSPSMTPAFSPWILPSPSPSPSSIATSAARSSAPSASPLPPPPPSELVCKSLDARFARSGSAPARPRDLGVAKRHVPARPATPPPRVTARPATPPPPRGGALPSRPLSRSKRPLTVPVAPALGPAARRASTPGGRGRCRSTTEPSLN